MEEQNGASGSPNETVSDDQQENTSQNSVNYLTHKRLLGQKKRQDEELDALRSKVESFEHSQLESEGKKDELINALRRQVAERDDRYKRDLGNLAYSTLQSQVKSEAASMGCVDNDALTKLLDLQTLEVDQETFRADKSEISNMLEDARQKMPYLFSKAGPQVDSHNLKAPNLKGNEPDLSEMTTAQMIAYAEKHGL